MKKTLLFTLFLFTPIFFFPQTPSDELKQKFDSIFLETATKTAYQNHARALQIADSLYENSTHEEFKLRALMLSATFHQSVGDLNQAISNAIRAEEIAIKTKNYQWHVRILGFLSSEYRNIGLTQERELVLNSLKLIIPKIKDEKQRNILYSMYYQELAFNLWGESDKSKVLDNLHLSGEYLNKLSDSPNKSLLLGVNEWIYANTIIENNLNPDSALVHLDKASQFFVEANNEEYLSDVILMNKGRAYFMKNEFETGFKYLKESEKINEQSENIYVKLKVYNELMEYYKAQKDTTNLFLYLEKYSQLQDYLYNEKIKPVEAQLMNLRSNKEALNKRNQLFFILLISILILSIVTYGWYNYSVKKKHKKFKQIIAELENKQLQNINDPEPELNPLPVQSNDSSNSKQTAKLQIPEETHQKILEDLRNFEESEMFLQNNITLAYLASEINVNTKYLSYVLNNDIGKDFNKFINECRIQYIVDKLYNNEDYRRYKLSILAEECGFSSHSKFSSVFKSVTNLTPSAFIKFLNEEENIKLEKKENISSEN